MSALGGTTATWNYNGTPATIGSTSYIYDADGNELTETNSVGTTPFLPGEQLTVSGTTTTGMRYYTFGGVTIAETNGSSLYWTEANLQGTLTTAVNAFSESSPVIYRTATPYGTMLGATGTWPDSRTFLNDFTNPDTGLVDIAARKFDPALGLFISVDPVVNTAEPQSMTGYTYGAGDPVNNSDPTGKMVVGDGCNGSACYHPTPAATQRPVSTYQAIFQIAYLITQLAASFGFGFSPAPVRTTPIFSFGGAFGGSPFTSSTPQHGGIPVTKTPIFEPNPVIKDPPGPEFPIGGDNIDPIPPDLGTGTETYPIYEPGPMVTYNSGKSVGQRIGEAFLILLLLGHDVSQIAHGDTLTSSKPPAYELQIEDPTPDELKNPKPDPDPGEERRRPHSSCMVNRTVKQPQQQDGA